MYTTWSVVNELSPKQKILLQLVRDFQRKHGHSPTLGELGKMFDTKHINTIVQLLEKLQEKGFIERIPGEERGIKVSQEGQQTIDIPVVGSVACGLPLLAQQNIEGYTPTDKKFITDDPKKYFYLRAVGDSMNLAGIDNGDLVLVHSQPTAAPEDRAVALIDDEATIKYVRPGDGYVALVPKSSNPDNKPIILHSDFSIQGIIKAVFKKEMLTA